MAFSFLKFSINSHHGVSFYLVIGVIADWKKTNHFTVTLNERFDRIFIPHTQTYTLRFLFCVPKMYFEI